MANDKYHHGDLRETLIKNGIKLLNEQGSENFSLRKLACMCNVSHAAPYKHFKSKEELIDAMLKYVFEKLEITLEETGRKYSEDYEHLTLELGKKYVSFMVENPDYLKILFLSDFKPKIIIKKDKVEAKYNAFIVFMKYSVKVFKKRGLKEEDYPRNIMAMWSMVHGIAIMLVNKTIVYKGDYNKLVEDILINNMKF